MTAATAALELDGLQVWLSPELFRKSRARTLAYLARAAASAAPLHDRFPARLVFCVGTESSLFTEATARLPLKRLRRSAAADPPPPPADALLVDDASCLFLQVQRHIDPVTGTRVTAIAVLLVRECAVGRRPGRVASLWDACPGASPRSGGHPACRIGRPSPARALTKWEKSLKVVLI